LLFISTLISFHTAYNYFFVTGKVNNVYQALLPVKYTWLQFTENLSIDMSILLDPISVMMLVVVTFVSLMVHIFSLGYMKGEARFPYLLRIPSALHFLHAWFGHLRKLVSKHIFFWELVGVSSYLLIGYYFDKPTAVAASKKAFIVTRFADLGFLIGILGPGVLWTNFGFQHPYRTPGCRSITAVANDNCSIIHGHLCTYLGLNTCFHRRCRASLPCSPFIFGYLMPWKVQPLLAR
jgi:NADH:ubiquinone oxidoreductase subunit 5 (subunit L)/multisubunit Na+/H+ antiporter MnhA subunit